MNKRLKIQLLEVEVNDKNDTVKISEELDKDYARLTGISMLLTSSDLNVINESTIDNVELFPKGFEADFFQSDSTVPPDERFLTIDREAAGNKINLEITDGGVGINYPYYMKIYLRLENPDCDHEDY